MKTTQYLYGIEPEELEGMEYFAALQFKYDSAVKLYRKFYFIPKRTEEEDVRMFHVEKAVQHTYKLIDERVGSPKVYRYPEPFGEPTSFFADVADGFRKILEKYKR